MMKKFNLISLLIFLLMVLTSCQSVQDGLAGSKRQGDEFLVKKKNPLVLPPDYGTLPIPKSEQQNAALKEDEDIDLKKIMGLSSNSENNTTSENGSLEKSILEKINAN